MTDASTPTPLVAPLHISPCPLISVHDADTFRVLLPLNFLWTEITTAEFDVRLAHVNAAELSTPEGKAAAASVKAWLVGKTPLTIHAYGRDKYGRLLADAETPADGLLSTFVLTLPGTVPMGLKELLA